MFVWRNNLYLGNKLFFVSVLGRKLARYLNLKIIIWEFKKVCNITGIIEKYFVVTSLTQTFYDDSWTSVSSILA